MSEIFTMDKNCKNFRACSKTVIDNCKIARFTNLAGNSILFSIILLIIGSVGIYFGFHIIGASIKFGIVTIGISIFVIAAAIGVFGIGTFATCF